MHFYYLQEKGQTTGPFDEGSLKSRFTGGELGPETMMWRDGWSSWRPAGAVMKDWFSPKSEVQAAPPTAPTAPTAPLDPTSPDDPTIPMEPGAASTGVGPPPPASGGGRGRPSAAWGRNLFVPGDVAAGRYRIVRFLGKGGMGEVYEAEDVELRERVALKTILPEAACDEVAAARFKREIHVARKVTHPNVCRIFDLGVHRWPPGPGGESGGDSALFLTMELIRGETLSQRLAGGKTLTHEESLPIARQMAEGLRAAHRAGVVHRDFKTGNVMLAPGERGGERVVVTDFGMARAASGAESFDVSRLTSDNLLGTPAFMAPEQVEGKVAGPPADIYAFGVVLYLMRTGTWPFTAENPLAAALKRTLEDPAPPSCVNPNVEPAWEKAILKCMARRPEDRFEDPVAAVDAIEGAAPADEGTQPVSARSTFSKKTAPPPVWKKLVLPLAAAALVLAVALALFLVPRRGVERGGAVGGVASSPKVAREIVPARRSAAVMGFKNLSARPETAWMSTALSEMVRTELSSAGRVLVLPNETVSRMRADLSLEETGVLDAGTLGRVRKNIGADLLVGGSYLNMGAKGDGRVRLEVHVQDAVSGERVASFVETGAESDLIGVVARAGRSLRKSVGGAPDGEGERPVAAGAMPRDAEALRLYSEGLDSMRRFDFARARDLLEKAVGRDEKSPMAFASLSRVYAMLGYETKSREAADEAAKRASVLGREDRLRVEALALAASKKWDKALEIFKSIWIFNPDSVDDGLRLADAQVSAGLGKGAMDTVLSLRELPRPASDDPRLDLMEGAAAGSLSDLKLSLACARRAVEKGRASESRQLTARGLFMSGMASTDLGDMDGAWKSLQEARSLFGQIGDIGGEASCLRAMGNIHYLRGELESAGRVFADLIRLYEGMGNRQGAAMAMGNRAIVLRAQGNPEAALEYYTRAARFFEEAGDKTNIGTSFNNMANVYYGRGELAKAREWFEKARDTYQAVGSKDGVAMAQNNIGAVLLDQGEIQAAADMFAGACDSYRSGGNRGGEALALRNLAEVLLALGKTAESRSGFQEALLVARETSNRSLEAQALFGLGNADLSDGKTAEAQKWLSESLKIQDEIGEKQEAAVSRLAIARATLQEGRPDAALSASAAAAGVFQGLGAVDWELQARTVAALAGLAKGDLPAAVGSIGEGRKLLPRVQSRQSRAQFFHAEAQVLAAEKRWGEALKSVAAAKGEAGRGRYVQEDLNIRLTECRILLESGRVGEGRRLLAALEKDARQAGMSGLADRAKALMEERR